MIKAITPPSLEAVDRYAATGSGAPSYVTGAQACSGTAATLKLSPASSRTTPALTSGRRCGSTTVARAAEIRSKCTAPVAAYSRAAPSSATAVDTTLTTKNVTAASEPAVLRVRRRPTSTYSGSVSVSSATISEIRSRAEPSTTPPVIEQASRKQYSPTGRSPLRRAGVDSASTPSVSSAKSPATTAAASSVTIEQADGEAQKAVNGPREELTKIAAPSVASDPIAPAPTTTPRLPETKSASNTTTAVPAA